MISLFQSWGNCAPNLPVIKYLKFGYYLTPPPPHPPPTLPRRSKYYFSFSIISAVSWFARYGRIGYFTQTILILYSTISQMILRLYSTISQMILRLYSTISKIILHNFADDSNIILHNLHLILICYFTILHLVRFER